MKTIFSALVTFLILTQNTFAGPSVSGGIPPHPAMITAVLETPQAGLDFPYDSQTDATAVLALYQGRILIFNAEKPEIVHAEAGVDYPTDTPAPHWTIYQRVLKFDDRNRIPLTTGYDSVQDKTVWNLPRGARVFAADIAKIEKSKAGVDYPTDLPPFGVWNTYFYVVELIDGTRVAL